MRTTFNYDHVRLRPSEQIGVHSQPSWELDLVVSGTGMRTIGDTTAPIAPGEVVLVPPHMRHEWRFDAHLPVIENVSITFLPGTIARLGQAMPELQPVAQFFGGLRESRSIEGALREQAAAAMLAMRRQPQAQRLIALLDLLREIAGSHSYQVAGTPPVAGTARERMRQVEVWVSCNHQRPVTLDDIARHVGMNRSAFCSWFRQHSGTTFGAYLTRRRMQMAEYLLTQPGNTVAGACHQSGFGDVAHFTRLFTRLHGMPPTRWAKQQKPGNAGASDCHVE